MAETAQTETAQTETAQTESAQTETAQTESARLKSPVPESGVNAQFCAGANQKFLKELLKYL